MTGLFAQISFEARRYRISRLRMTESTLLLQLLWLCAVVAFDDHQIALGERRAFGNQRLILR